MGKNLEITNLLEKYIENFSHSLHPIQKEIISYNESLGDIKRMQIAVSQCYFLDLIIKVSNSKKILEIGTFTGLSALSMSLALPYDGSVIALDKNIETNKIATNFFIKANQEKTLDVEVTTAYELSSETLDKLAKSLKTRLQRDVNLNTNIDQSLLGGAIIRMDDTVIDSSVRGKLVKLAESMNS